MRMAADIMSKVAGQSTSITTTTKTIIRRHRSVLTKTLETRTRVSSDVSRGIAAFPLLFLLSNPVDGELYHFFRILETEFLFDVRSVCLNCLDAQVERFRDRPGRATLAKQLQHLQFPIRQCIHWRTGSGLR